MDLIRDAFSSMASRLGRELTESDVAEHIAPLFSRVLKRDEIYLANHSLGRPLDAMGEDVRDAVDAWYTQMDGAWGGWLETRDRYRALVAKLIGRGRADAVVPKTAAGQGMRAILNAFPVNKRPLRVVATRGEFDSIDQVLRVYEQRGLVSMQWAEPDASGMFSAEAIAALIEPGVDLVVFSAVVFATGQRIEELEKVVRKARDVGAVSVVDTYHLAGVLPMDADGMDADFMIGGNYKYTRGGAGACWMSVHDRHLSDSAVEVTAEGICPIDTGWFAKESPFAYERPHPPRLAAGGDAWLESTPPVLVYAQAVAGLEFTLAVGLNRLAAYNTKQQHALIDALRAHGHDALPIDPRGAYLLVAQPIEMSDVQRLKQAGVNADARPCRGLGTTHLRLCPDVLTTTDEMTRAAELIGRVIPPTGGG